MILKRTQTYHFNQFSVYPLSTGFVSLFPSSCWHCHLLFASVILTALGISHKWKHTFVLCVCVSAVQGVEPWPSFATAWAMPVAQCVLYDWLTSPPQRFLCVVSWVSFLPFKRMDNIPLWVFIICSFFIFQWFASTSWLLWIMPLQIAGTAVFRSYPKICRSSRGVAGYYDTVMKIEKLLYVLYVCWATIPCDVSVSSVKGPVSPQSPCLLSAFLRIVATWTCVKMASCLNLQLSSDSRCWVSLRVFIGCLCIFFEKTSVQVIVHFSTGLFPQL